MTKQKRLFPTGQKYNKNERYQWNLAKLASAEYYQYRIIGTYSLLIPKAKGKDWLCLPSRTNSTRQIDKLIIWIDKKQIVIDKEYILLK